jgi:hypothetical protein
MVASLLVELSKAAASLVPAVTQRLDDERTLRLLALAPLKEQARCLAAIGPQQANSLLNKMEAPQREALEKCLQQMWPESIQGIREVQALSKGEGRWKRRGSKFKTSPEKAAQNNEAARKQSESIVALGPEARSQKGNKAKVKDVLDFRALPLQKVDKPKKAPKV